MIAASRTVEPRTVEPRTVEPRALAPTSSFRPAPLGSALPGLSLVLSLASALVLAVILPGTALAAGSMSDGEAMATDPLAQVLEAQDWREVGPYRGGRSAAVAGIPDQPEVYYFGATGGGVWKTEDAGESWANVSDGYFGGSIGAVAVSEWDPNVVYVGGGEKTVRGNVSHGDGVWKSTDAGRTWTAMGLADSRHIPRIRIHPKDPDRLWVAALGHLYGPNEERGVYRSTDGGETWERVLFVSEDAGAVDLILDPTNPRILYASFWRVRRTPYSLESGGEGSSLWKSTDGGTTWTELTDRPGLPEKPWGISGITVSPSDPDNLYAIVEAPEGGVFRSRDGGQTWRKTNDERKLRQRAWYYTRIYADPVDAEAVYVVNVQFHRSKDGGQTFEDIPTPHGDNHDLWIDPDDPERMIEANDGGANVTTDGGEHWTTQANQPTAQMYRVSTDNAFPYRLLGGQQDNSAVRIRSRSAFGSAITTRDWEPTAGGESGHVVADPDDPEVVYGGSYGGFLVRLDHRTGETRAVNVWPDDPMGGGAGDWKHRFQWNFPLQFSIHDPDRLYAAAERLFVSHDEGQSWRAISPDLTRADPETLKSSGGPITQDNTGVEYYATLFALAESPFQQGVIWAGSDDGRLHVTRDDGGTWTEVTPPDLPEWTLINSIDAHPFEEGGLYLAGTRYKLDDFTPYLYRTTDWGETWTRIDGGIPRDHFTRVVRADPGRRGLLYAGTERGVYTSFDDGRSWHSLQGGAPEDGGLPLVPVTDLAVKVVDGRSDLVAATQGRGYWILDDLSLLHQLAPALADGELAEGEAGHGVTLFEPQPAYRLAGGRGWGTPENAGTNPAPGVGLVYRLPEAVDEETALRLEILEGTGEGEDAVIRTLTRKKDDAGGEGRGRRGRRGGGAELAVLPAEAGVHRVHWDLSYPPAEDFPGMILWNGNLEGPTAVPGTYRARLTVGEETREVAFEVVADPRSSATPEDYAAQFAFVRDLRDRLTAMHREIGRIRATRDQLEALTGSLAATDLTEGERTRVKEAAEALSEELHAVEKALYQTQNQSRQDPLNFPIRLNDKLAGVKGLASFGDRRPTDAMVEVRRELEGRIDGELETLERLWAEDLPAVNALAREAGVAVIRVDFREDPGGEEPVEEDGGAGAER